MKESIHIKKLGPIKDVYIGDVKKIMVVIGDSGGGKSTIMKVLALFRWIMKMMNIRSYLKYSKITKSPFRFRLDKYLKVTGLKEFVSVYTEIYYNYGSVEISLVNGKLRDVNKLVPQSELSLEKISFISDKRGVLADILARNMVSSTIPFYLKETLDDFEEANGAIDKSINMPFLGVNYVVYKGKLNKQKYQIQVLESGVEIPFVEASSGMRTTTPVYVIVDFFAKQFDIVGRLNKTIFNYMIQNDSLFDFKPVKDIGEIKNQRVSLLVEEPELSLDPRSQYKMLESIIEKTMKSCQNNIHLFMATHSPYMFNALNVLLRKGTVSKDDLGVYHVVDGSVYNLLSQDIESGQWFVDTTELSDPMNEIYDDYVKFNDLNV